MGYPNKEDGDSIYYDIKYVKSNDISMIMNNKFQNIGSSESFYQPKHVTPPKCGLVSSSFKLPPSFCEYCDNHCCPKVFIYINPRQKELNNFM